MPQAKESLQKLYLEQLRDLFSAESQILEALPKMIKKTTHAELKRGFDGTPHAFDALTVTFGAGQSAFGCPPAVAVHDDRDMANGRSVGPLPSKLIHRKRHVRLRVVGKGVVRPLPN